MFSAYGWFRLQTPRPELEAPDWREQQRRADGADEQLWVAFRKFMGDIDHQWIEWQLFEHLNNDTGVLTLCTSRNHRRRDVFEIVAWIASASSSSYGLLYVHDDEDQSVAASQGSPTDNSNLHRVHRVRNGTVTEHADPFFGPISPSQRPD